MKYRREHFIEELIKHEGLKLQVYKDTLGIDTIGIGRNLEDRGISQEELDDLDIPNMDVIYEYGITEADAVYLAQNDVQIVEDELLRAHPCVDRLDSVRQLILMDMAFNMGVPRLCKFQKMWNAIHEEKYDVAAKEMLDSRWANQVKSRAIKLANAMHNGEFQWTKNLKYAKPALHHLTVKQLRLVRTKASNMWPYNEEEKQWLDN